MDFYIMTNSFLWYMPLTFLIVQEKPNKNNISKDKIEINLKIIVIDKLKQKYQSFKNNS